MNNLQKYAEQLNNELSDKSLLEQFEILSQKFTGKIAFSTSFGQEDQVITHYIFSNNLPVRIFTLDTGRMFEETYKTFGTTIRKYEKKIDVYFPDKQDVEKLLTEKGAFSFYDSVENRKECCRIRKVLPLQRALKNTDLWITGLRSTQSDSRADLQFVQYDENFDLIKFNPLKNWTLEQVTKYIFDNNIPYNSLHDKGFISIGCAPCTRAIQAGENIRAGRWWWEDSSKKECGLHEK